MMTALCGNVDYQTARHSCVHRRNTWLYKPLSGEAEGHKGNPIGSAFQGSLHDIMLSQSPYRCRMGLVLMRNQEGNSIGVSSFNILCVAWILTIIFRPSPCIPCLQAGTHIVSKSHALLHVTSPLSLVHQLRKQTQLACPVYISILDSYHHLSFVSLHSLPSSWYPNCQ